MTGSPLFTVVTLTYNASKWVHQAIESVLAQTFTDFEYIIIDDCSPDNTWGIIDRYKDERITALRNDSNMGEYPNRNKALKMAKGQWLVFVDGDDVLYRESLDRLAYYIKEYPEAVSVWGINSQDIHYFIFPYLIDSSFLMKCIFLTRFYNIHNVGFSETFFRISTLRSLGGFSESYIMGDVDIKRRIPITGPVLLVPLGFEYWRRSPHQATKRAQQNFKSYIENYRINRSVLPLIKKENLLEDYATTAEENIRISEVKLLFQNTIFKMKFGSFFNLSKTINFSLKDIRYLFKKGNYSFEEEMLKKIPFSN